MPAVRKASEGGGPQNFAFVVPLWIMLVWFLVLLVSDARAQQEAQGSNTSLLRVSIPRGLQASMVLCKCQSCSLWMSSKT